MSQLFVEISLEQQETISGGSSKEDKKGKDKDKKGKGYGKGGLKFDLKELKIGDLYSSVVIIGSTVKNPYFTFSEWKKDA
ncbi:MAG TPA: hypothetical protein VK184_01700 [Nostocaceae cyanobacterium]|nr:hypothetical protein [Nostocaceae cyanobacterium]